MLDAEEIAVEIARLEYQESSYPNYAKLANLYTIRDQMNKGLQSDVSYEQQYSRLASTSTVIESTGESEFMQAVAGKDTSSVWKVIDELMETLSFTKPKVYKKVLNEILSIGNYGE